MKEFLPSDTASGAGMVDGPWLEVAVAVWCGA